MTETTRTFEGTRVDLVGGMIVWRFIIGSGIYRVNSQQYWDGWPTEELLGVLYRHDKRRLEAWLGQKDLYGGSRDYRPLVEIPKTHYVPPIRKPPGPKPSGISERLQRKLRAKPHWFLQPDPNKYYAAFPLSDHDYIEAMFWLYSQERSRLLA